jgi:hypothetical protein
MDSTSTHIAYGHQVTCLGVTWCHELTPTLKQIHVLSFPIEFVSGPGSFISFRSRSASSKVFTPVVSRVHAVSFVRFLCVSEDRLLQN